MGRRLAGFMIDCREGDLASARAFWSRALGVPVIDADEGGAGRYAVLGNPVDGLHVEVQMVEHDSRLHLDIEADDIDVEASRLEVLGAQRIGNPRGRWWVMQAPTGHRFCVIRPHGGSGFSRDRLAKDVAAGTQQTNVWSAAPTGSGHHSGLVALVLDCQVDSLDAALDFWSAALVRPIASRDQDGDGKYGELESADDEPFVLLQMVTHEPRVHLDIETDNLEAEVARLEALGATRVAFVRRWWVMQAPTGHRFCVVGQQPRKAGLRRNAWA